eukprot:COSAG02_NODE_12563_length_1525_cov_1.239130_1_plen_389_part_10
MASGRSDGFFSLLLAMLLAGLVGGGMPLPPEQPQTVGGPVGGLAGVAEGVVGESGLGLKRPGGNDWAGAARSPGLGGAESADAGGRTDGWGTAGALAAGAADETVDAPAGRLLQTTDGLMGNGTNGTNTTGADGVLDSGPAVQLNFTKICTEQLYPAQHPECLAMLLAKCEGSNYTLPLCVERGVDECSGDNGGCGDPQYITCSVRTWDTWGTQTANLTMVRVPRNWTDGTGSSEGANVTEWETVDITFEENQTKIEALVAAQGEVFHTLGEIPLAIPNRELSCTDVNECLTDNGGCGDPQYARCENKYARPVRCRDINECEHDNGGCGDPLFSRCINYENHNKKDFVVTTPRNHTCRDIDECATNNGGCGDPEFFSCTNRGGEDGGVF